VPDPPAEEFHAVAGEYFRLQLACPFLEDEACSIHPDRPFACREYLVTSDPAHCASFSRQGIRKVFVPMDMPSALQKACVEAGADRPVLPLVWSLDWSAAHPEVAARRFNGVQLFTNLVQEVDAVCRVLADFTPDTAADAPEV
jgi:Fe-S-cluster containining protein